MLTKSYLRGAPQGKGAMCSSLFCFQCLFVVLCVCPSFFVLVCSFPRGPPESSRPLYYKATDGEVYGPFSEEQILQWVNAGYFQDDLPVSFGPDDDFIPLSVVLQGMQHTDIYETQFTPGPGPTIPINPAHEEPKQSIFKMMTTMKKKASKLVPRQIKKMVRPSRYNDAELDALWSKKNRGSKPAGTNNADSDLQDRFTTAPDPTLLEPFITNDGEISRDIDAFEDEDVTLDMNDPAVNPPFSGEEMINNPSASNSGSSLNTCDESSQFAQLKRDSYEVNLKSTHKPNYSQREVLQQWDGSPPSSGISNMLRSAKRNVFGVFSTISFLVRMIFGVSELISWVFLISAIIPPEDWSILSSYTEEIMYRLRTIQFDWISTRQWLELGSSLSQKGAEWIKMPIPTATTIVAVAALFRPRMWGRETVEMIIFILCVALLSSSDLSSADVREVVQLLQVLCVVMGLRWIGRVITSKAEDSVDGDEVIADSSFDRSTAQQYGW